MNTHPLLFLFLLTFNICTRLTQNPQINRQNPTVFNNAAKAFTFVVQALEAETLQGATAARVASSAKQLATAAAVNVDQIFANVNPKYQMAVRSFFQ